SDVWSSELGLPRRRGAVFERLGAGGAAPPPGAGHRHRRRLDACRADVRCAARTAGRRMKVALRTDASMRIGTGHLMRCLTLADALRDAGARTRFVCRALPHGLREVVIGRGHELVELPSVCGSTAGGGDGRGAPVASPHTALEHADWLGTTQEEDAAATCDALDDGAVWDWLAVDHYAIDARWETRLRTAARRILAIDDLADRRHDCDALLDQNLHAGMHARYDGLVPDACVRLVGPRHALLRPEFAAAR